MSSISAALAIQATGPIVRRLEPWSKANFARSVAGYSITLVAQVHRLAGHWVAGHLKT